MKSKESSMLQNLSHDVPTTGADIAALNYSRKIHNPDLRDYLEFLANVPDTPTSILRTRKGPAGDKAFKL